MNIHYVTGSRADFGLMRQCLLKLQQLHVHQIGVIITGQHTVPKYGDTARYVHESGLPVIHEIPIELNGETGAEMAVALAKELSGLTSFWEQERPDLVLVLGDRGEMLAAALAAAHLGIHVAHIHGGERSGTLDESFRHAISKISHLHFPATEDAKARLIAMGERPETITVIGAPGLVGISGSFAAAPSALRKKFNLPGDQPVALCLFHPVVQEAAQAAEQVELVIKAARGEGYALIVVRPNSDAGGNAIDAYLDTLQGYADVCIVTHLDRDEYLQSLASCDLIIGNSSSGIIESASFGVPCVNIGSRQNDRLRNLNTFDCAEISMKAIRKTIGQAQAWPSGKHNLYGDGRTDEYLAAAVTRLQLSPDLLVKRNSY